MREFNWSVSARSILSEFYEVDLLIYVEGQDDVPFWDIIISQFTIKKYKLKSAGDKNSLKKYFVEKNSESTYLIAMDSDYDQLSNELNNKEVMLTYGYSIENTLITPSVIQDLIVTHSKVQKDSVDIEKIKVWLEEFENAVEPLLAADILNRNRKVTSEQVIPDNSTRFYDNGSLVPQSHKINEYLVQHGFVLNELFCREQIQQFTIFEITKGHFVFSSVYNFIKKQIDSYREKSVSISNESFYSFCISSFKNSFNNNHPHYKYYKDMVSHHIN